MSDKAQRKQKDKHDNREGSLDKTIADSFPTSDPPSTIPDPVPASPGTALEEDESSDK